MAENKQITSGVLAIVGGSENVTSVTHCMMRLRFNLKDESIPKDDEVKNIDGVLGCQWSGGQYQIIVGQNVPKVYNVLVASGVNAGGMIGDNLDASLPKEKLTAKKVGGNILNYLSKFMVALIPITLASVLFRTIAVVAGSSILNL